MLVFPSQGLYNSLPEKNRLVSCHTSYLDVWTFPHDASVRDLCRLSSPSSGVGGPGPWPLQPPPSFGAPQLPICCMYSALGSISWILTLIILHRQLLKSITYSAKQLESSGRVIKWERLTQVSVGTALFCLTHMHIRIAHNQMNVCDRPENSFSNHV